MSIPSKELRARVKKIEATLATLHADIDEIVKDRVYAAAAEISGIPVGVLKQSIVDRASEQRARTSLRMAKTHRNLSHRPAKPALGNCRRAFIAHDGTISTSEAVDWCYARRLMFEPRRRSFCRATIRALASTGDPAIGA